MATPNGAILIDWERAMPPDSPPAELELVGPSSSPMTPQPPTATQTDTDDASGDNDGAAAEFAGLTDQQLRAKLKRVRSVPGVMARTPDGGEKMRILARRIEKELDRRCAAGPRKDDTARRQSVQPPNGDDPYDINDVDELNQDSIAGKYCSNASFTPPTKSYGEEKGAAFTKELHHFSHACLKQDGQRARTIASHQPKNLAVFPKSAEHKRLNMDGNITNNKRKGHKSCVRNRQKNNYVDSKGMCHKLHKEDGTFGNSTKRWDRSENRTFESWSSFNSNKRQEKKDVVLLDDEDMEPAKSVDTETAHKWDEAKIHYPSRTDLETVELTYSDIKCLEPEEYLKSPVINFYIEYLKKSRPRGDLYMFNTYFYSKLEEALSRTGNRDSQFSKLRRWWKSVDIFKKAYIIVPIHGMMHWSLIIICMPAKETESGPIMLHLDSLGLHSSHDVYAVIQKTGACCVLSLFGKLVSPSFVLLNYFSLVHEFVIVCYRSYLEAEWRHLQNDSSYDIPFSGWIWSRLSRNISKEKVEVPRQQNEFDCGIFMLYYIDRFIQEAPERLTRQNLCMFGRKWFNPEEASGLRQGIRALLLDVFLSARLDDGTSESESHSDDHPEGEDKGSDAVMTITLESSDE